MLTDLDYFKGEVKAKQTQEKKRNDFTWREN